MRNDGKERESERRHKKEKEVLERNELKRTKEDELIRVNQGDVLSDHFKHHYYEAAVQLGDDKDEHEHSSERCWEARCSRLFLSSSCSKSTIAWTL